MWFTETPWPPILVCIVLCVVLVVSWYSTQRESVLLGVPVLLVLSGVIYFVEHRIVTERERVEESVVQFVTTFREESGIFNAGERLFGNAVPKTLEFISPSAVDVKQRVEVALALVNVKDDLRITDLNVEMKSANSRAVAHFRANATVSAAVGDLGHQPSRWQVTWQRESDNWKVVKVDRLNFFTGEIIDTFAQQQ